MDRYVLLAEAYQAVIQRRNRLKTAWRSTLNPLHECPMSRQYRNAMSIAVDIDTFDLDRDVDFAMRTLLPRTIDLLTAGKKPSMQDLLKTPWVNTRLPGNYSILAWTVDEDGNVDQVVLKVGCAWSEDGGLKTRGYQLGEAASAQSADFGSPFHTFIQDNRAKGRKVYTHKSTLAIGEPFIRRNTDDFDYLPARFYQLESMLAAAFGSPLSTQKNPQFLALVGWPYVDDNSDYEWKGADSHSALKDRWPPPSLTGPSELRLPCPIDGCYRNHRDLYGFRSQDALDIHVDAHSLGTIGLHQGAFRSCIDPRCAVEGYPFDLSLHEAQHIDGEWPCGACGLQFRWSHDCEKHVDVCSVDDAIDLHKAAREVTKLAKMLVCDDHRCGHELEYNQYNVDMMAIHRQMHVDSNHICPECRLRLKTGAVKMHRDKYCPGRPKPEEEPISTDLVCTDWRCKKRYINGNVQQYNNYVKHLQSHVDGKFTCVDCGVKLSDVRRRAAHKRDSCPGKGAQKPVDSNETTSISTEKSLISTKVMPEMTFFHEMPKPIRDLEVAMELLAEVCEPIVTITFEMDKHVALL